MKTILPLLLLTTAVQAQPNFVIDLVSDQDTYAQSQAAVLLGNVVHAPTNDGLELYFEAKLNGVPVKAIKLSDSNVLTLSDPLLIPGNNDGIYL